MATKDPYSSLMGTGLRALERRSHTVQEFREKLRKNPNHSPQVEEQVVQRFLELKLLDDASYTARAFERYASTKPLGPRGLKARLFRKGIPASLVDATFKQAEISEKDLAIKALQTQARKWQNLDPHVRAQRQLRFLASRGFSSELCFQLAKIHESN